MKILQTVLEQNADARHCLFRAEDFYAVFPAFTMTNLRMLLSRAAKNGLLERVCSGIYLYPKSGYDLSNVLFRTAAKLRANHLSYVSLETVLASHGIISQQLMSWITIMTKGRSGIIGCGRFGSIEFIHTAKSQDTIMPQLHLDAVSGMWWASPKLALQDMSDAKRQTDLVDMSDMML